MAKLRRAVKARSSSSRKPARAARPKAKRSPAVRRSVRPAKRVRKGTARKAAPKAAAKPSPKPKPIKAAPPPPPPPPAPPAPPVRKPTYHEAVAMYERGLQALQRRDFATSAELLRNVIERYPDERELLERARLYLKVCERELEPKEPTPKTPNEWVYAGTVALNAGDEATARRHLQRALTDDPRHDHAHYMMATISARRGEAAAAIEHLRQAVSLNPDNRSLARQDPELETLREHADFRAITELLSDASRQAPPRTRPKTRR